MMKRKISLAVAVAALLGVLTTVNLPQTRAEGRNVGQIVAALLNISLVNVQANIGDITVTDVVDVSNVLNQNDIRVLNNVLNNNRNLANNLIGLNLLLQHIDVDVNHAIADNVVVVGVNLLTGQILVLPAALIPIPLP